MEPIYHYVIELEPRTKKNHQMIAGTGAKCPVCRKPARQFIRQGKANTEFAFLAAKYIRPHPPAPLQGPLHIVYKLYMGTKRKVDDLNLYAALDDILVTTQVLADDNVKVIRDRDGSGVFYDKEHPRAEIYIYNFAKEETNGF